MFGIIRKTADLFYRQTVLIFLIPYNVINITFHRRDGSTNLNVYMSSDSKLNLFKRLAVLE